jgi:DNA mismatch endonuclease, patch repair protein
VSGAMLPKVRVSFRGLRPSTPAASRTGRGNRRSRTKPEVLLCAALRQVGLRPRSNDRSLPGCPDFTFRAEKVAVFCDGDFWHGRNWRRRRVKLSQGANAGYWVAKISGNRARDRRLVLSLRHRGWQVVRVWESDVLADALKIARRIAALVSSHG